jgi:hypothetical protein
MVTGGYSYNTECVEDHYNYRVHMMIAIDFQDLELCPLFNNFCCGRRYRSRPSTARTGLPGLLYQVHQDYLDYQDYH